ncbi:MAG: sigma-70 family RNA polymerase sigma factor [Planctomycetota bacterium]
MMESAMGFNAQPFRTTSWSVVLRARDVDDESQRREALETLCQAYWYPLYSFCRRRGADSDAAQDITQSFFARLIEKESFSEVTPEKGRFRSYLLACMEHFLANHWRDNKAQRRGGGKKVLSIHAGEGEKRYLSEPVNNETPETQFNRAWARSVLDQAQQRIRCEFEEAEKVQLFEAISPYLSRRPGKSSYESLSDELGMTRSALAMTVRRMRERFGGHIRQLVSETLESPDLVDEELSFLLESLRQR